VPEWEPVIGLEIHVQLKTHTKMFCGCEAGFGGEPNTRTCPVCLALPGALPVPNETAVEWTIKLGHALNCRIAERAVFHRKNYFYPDNPKGYQISQYDEPLCIDGSFVVPGPETDTEVGIVRAHLEEDAAKTIHVGGATGRIVGSAHSNVDFNRGGTPLVEIVTQPDLRSADDAKRFLQLLRQTIVELGISDAEMEKGTLRADANVSVREVGETGYRTRTELKNMNSFNHIARGIEAELRRQIETWESGGEVVQETLDYEVKSDTVTSRRRKEEADDYRYFPEPDLVPLEPEVDVVERLRTEVPELPGARIRRFETQYGLPHYDAEVINASAALAALFERVALGGVDAKAASNVLMNEFSAVGVDPSLVNGTELAKLIQARDRIPRDVFMKALSSSGDPGFRAELYLGATKITNFDLLAPMLSASYGASSSQIESYKSGKEGVVGFLVGDVMKRSQGSADPELIKTRWLHLSKLMEPALVESGVPEGEAFKVMRDIDMALVTRPGWIARLSGNEIVFEPGPQKKADPIRWNLARFWDASLGPVQGSQDLVRALIEAEQPSDDPLACPVCGTHVEAAITYSVGAGEDMREPDTQSTRCPTCGTPLRRNINGPWTIGS
jgi:aspartyl-tRNA(Asn)/glutamyl-tRNA(Gln) amidotransferase subunit B